MTRDAERVLAALACGGWLTTKEICDKADMTLPDGTVYRSLAYPALRELLANDLIEKKRDRYRNLYRKRLDQLPTAA